MHKMPVQSVIHYRKFQESELQDSEKRLKLGDVARPRKCPYCGAKECMTLHEWVIRFLLIFMGGSYTLLVPVYKCKECKRYIRVLPKQCHIYHQHSSSSIKHALKLYYRSGKYVRIRWIDPALMRRWVRSFEENARSFSNLILKGFQRALEEIPRFSILFRQDVKIMGPDEFFGLSRTTQRPVTLAVCL